MTSKQAKKLEKFITAIVNLGFVALFMWTWNPFNFSGDKQWAAAYLLYCFFSLSSSIYRIEKVLGA